MQKVTIKREDLDFQCREAYKTLRSNIEFCGKDIHSFAITSCIPNEGKSEVSFEVAISFAQSGKKVLLIDADLRKSVFTEHLKSGRIRYGLTNYFAGQCSLEECTCSTDEPNFYLIVCGPHSPIPTELLSSSMFDELIETAKKEYDLVIIDTPPVASVIDAALVGQKVDGVVVTVASGAVSYQLLQDVIDQLKTANCRILGCVLNKADLGGSGTYGKYYGKYGEYGSKDLPLLQHGTTG